MQRAASKTVPSSLEKYDKERKSEDGSVTVCETYLFEKDTILAPLFDPSDGVSFHADYQNLVGVAN